MPRPPQGQPGHFEPASASKVESYFEVAADAFDS